MQDWKMMDKSAGLENAGLENDKVAGVENAGLENDGQICRGWKMQDWKLTDKSIGLQPVKM